MDESGATPSDAGQPAARPGTGHPPAAIAATFSTEPGWQDPRPLGMVTATPDGSPRYTDHGLVIDDEVIAFADVVALSFPGSSSNGETADVAFTIGGASHETRHVSLTGRSDARETLDLTWSRVVPKLVADAVEHISCGVELMIGSLRIDHQGFGPGGAPVPWQQFGGVTSCGDHFEVRCRDHNGSRVVATIGFGEPNAPVAYALLPYLASHAPAIRPLSAFGRRMLDIGPLPPIGPVAGAAPLVPPHSRPAPATGRSHARRTRHRSLHRTFSQRFTPRLLGRVGLVTILAAAIATKVVTAARDISPTPPIGSSTVRAWDPRVADVVAFVEKTSGRPFLHAVTVAFLADEAYAARLDAARPATAAPDSTTSALLRARGYDAFAPATSSDLPDGDASYLQATDEIVVRGTTMFPDKKLALVHQLVHAWQRQLYPDDERQGIDATQYVVRTALREGNAQRIERTYRSALSASDSASVTPEGTVWRDADLRQADAAPVTVIETGRYDIGRGLAGFAARNGRLDEQLRSPTFDERDILLPDLHTAATRPPAPPLEASDVPVPAGGYRSDVLDDGALSLYLTLASRLDALTSWRVATTPGLGITTVPFRRRQVVCVRSAMTVADAPARAALAGALATWASAGPVGAATAVASREGIVFTSCDPGRVGTAPAGALQSLSRFVLSSQAASAHLAQVAPGTDRRCPLEKLRATFDASAVDVADGNTPPAVVAAADAAAGSC